LLISSTDINLLSFCINFNIFNYLYNNLPSSITFPEDFWKDVFKIYKQTNQDGLERAIALFWADGELVLTSVVKGDDQSVRSSHNVRVNYVPHPYSPRIP